MRNKSTIEDIAKKAGVGTATVDRVLNERGGVSDEKHKKVIDAARSLGFNRILPRGSYRSVRVEVILNRPELPFIMRMNDEFKRLSQKSDRDIIIQRRILPDDEAKTISDALQATVADCVIVYAKSHPKIEQTIARLDAKGVKVVTLISDLPSSKRSAFAGPENISVGRTAAFFMSRFAQGDKKYFIIRDHNNLHAHDLRVNGFKNYLAEHQGAGEILAILDGGDDRNQTELVLRQAFANFENIAGIYNTGAGNLGVEAAIKAQGAHFRPVFIGHELTKNTDRLLREGIMTLTIDQSPEQQSQYALDLALHLIGHRELPEHSNIHESPIPFTIYTAENIPKGAKFDWM